MGDQSTAMDVDGLSTGSSVAAQPEAPTLPPPQFPSPLEQKQIIRALLDSANGDGITQGRKYALVPTKWWRSWKSFCGYDSDSTSEVDSPGAIDNSGLIEQIDGEVVVKKVRRICGCAGLPSDFSCLIHLLMCPRLYRKCGITK
jgi:hypothetical protein